MQTDICGAWSDNERCGGCLECQLMQAEYATGKHAERANKAEAEVKRLEKREQELVASCIQKNSQYQVMLRMAQTFQDALKKNPLQQSESLALYWMNLALDLNSENKKDAKDQALRNAKAQIVSLSEYASFMGNLMLKEAKNGNYVGDFYSQNKPLLDEIDTALK